MERTIEVIMEWNELQQKWLMKLRKSKALLQEFFDCQNVRKYFVGLDKKVSTPYSMVIKKLEVK